jgi:hypothetical protein
VASESEDIKLANYAVTFIDLLGQKAAMAGEHLLPEFPDKERYEAFLAKVRQSVGSVYALYEHADSMLREMHARSDSPLRESLTPEQKVEWDRIQAPTVRSQRWSDGLMAFASIASPDSPCPTIGIFDLLALSGALCLIGLSSKRPVRGGIDLAWGVQFRAGELHGPAVACAYQLESEVAGYPRIVVSAELNDYLHYCRAARGSPEHLMLSSFANRCLTMLTTDTDGVVVVDYLGRGFREAVSESQHSTLYASALAFVRDQFQAHTDSGDEKLAGRYSSLVRYFEARSPC